MTDKTTTPIRRLRSFVRRSGRRTSGQERARALLTPQFGLDATKKIHYAEIFQRVAPCFLEIGFGSGQTLLAAAQAMPEFDFIGVETHQPGLGALFLGMEQLSLTNIRVCDADVIDVLTNCLPAGQLAGVNIFFPDPWPKRRQHARRLIQPAFLSLLQTCLQPGATIHLATDWEHYAKHMMAVLSADAALVNEAGLHQFASRSPYRPILSKFERRAEREGRAVFELQFRYKPL